MDVFECITNRRSIRSFKKDPVSDQMIGVMLYCATHAPSAGNTQEWHFIVVKDDDVKKELADAALKQSFIADAPVVIVVCIDKEKIKLRYAERGESLYSIQDTACATMNMLLAAEEMGLGTCWVGSFDEDALEHILELPNQLRAVAIIPVGYSDEEKKKPRRIDFENVTHVNKYGQKYRIAESVKTAGGKDVKFTPIGNYIEEVLRKRKEKKKE